MCHNYKLFSVSWEQLYKAFFILSLLSFICPVKNADKAPGFTNGSVEKQSQGVCLFLFSPLLTLKISDNIQKLLWINKKADKNAGWVCSWKASKVEKYDSNFLLMGFCYLIGGAVIISFNWYYLAPAFPDSKTVVGTSFVLSCWDSFAIYPAMQICYVFELPLLNSVFDTTNYNFLRSFWRILSFVSVWSHDSW